MGHITHRLERSNVRLLAPLEVSIYRRGRGIIVRNFKYYDAKAVAFLKDSRVTSPGWYYPARKHVWRITIDHDYPTKPVWLGFRVEGKTWVNAEGLYEPILVRIGDKILYEGRPRGREARLNETHGYISREVARSF